MIFKLIIFLLIAYWIVRVAMNMARAIMKDDGGGRIELDSPSFRDDPVRRKVDGQIYAHTWHVKTPPASFGEDGRVEDARFRDV